MITLSHYQCDLYNDVNRFVVKNTKNISLNILKITQLIMIVYLDQYIKFQAFKSML